MSQPHDAIQLSVVIPFYNEEPNVDPVLSELLEVLDALAAEREWRYEVLCIDDGSTDRTLELLLAWVERRPEVRVIQFGVNYGQTAALSAGFHQARGQFVVTLDGDGQNDPHDIPRLLEVQARTDADVVSGWRQNRKDPWLSRRLPSMIANRLVSTLTGVPLRDSGCTLKVYRGEILRDLHLYGEMHRFTPALARWQGAKVVEEPVNHRPRSRGQSKYGLSRVIRVVLDLLVVKFLMHYSTRPIQFFGIVGLVVALFGLGCLGFVVYYKYFDGLTMNRNPLLYVGLTLEMIACQIVLMGLLGEMMTRVYYETQRKPIYRIKRVFLHDAASTDTGHARVVAVDPRPVG